MSNQPESSGRVSVDKDIDAIAQVALEEARRLEEAQREAQRYRDNPGPIAPPQPSTITPA
jgi:hypothetical protein